jgi:hypothetical protein
MSEYPQVRRFQASRLWEFNVYGAIIGGLGGGAILLVVAGILISDGIGLDQASFLAAFLITNVLAGLLLLYPGNLAVAFPYAVEIEHGRGLRLFGPMKNVYVPLMDVKEVRSSFLAFGWVVKLRRGQRALTAFTIHRGFGPEGRELACTIEQEIARLSFIPK